MVPPTLPPPRTVLVPPPPKPHVLRFLVGVGNLYRPNPNTLVPSATVVAPVLRVALEHAGAIYDGWHLDPEQAELWMEDSAGRVVRIGADSLTHEEVTAVRFLSAAVDWCGGPGRCTNGWRAHVLDQLSQMVPVYDMSVGGPLDLSKATDFYRKSAVLN